MDVYGKSIETKMENFIEKMVLLSSITVTAVLLSGNTSILTVFYIENFVLLKSGTMKTALLGVCTSIYMENISEKIKKDFGPFGIDLPMISVRTRNF
jgi:hypothetical protein